MKSVYIFIVFLSTLHCARAPVKEAHQAMRPTTSLKLIDDLPLKTFVTGLVQSIERLAKDPETYMQFGPTQIKKGDYVRALEDLLRQLRQMGSKAEFLKHLENNFDFYEVYGGQGWGEVFITGYFDPVIYGSLKPTVERPQPLYKTPPDMVTINIGKYAEVFPKWSVFADQVLEQKSRQAIVRGRLVKSKNANGVPEIHPYFSREEIDEMQKLKHLGLELVYVSPIDSFFIQIQGSGIVELPSGQHMRVGYDSQNGHPYVAIGAHLLDVIPLEKMSLQKIEQHLKQLPRQEQQKIFNKNPSYVFFRKLQGPSQTFFATNVVAGRTIATDYGLFPKGAVAFLQFEKPLFANAESEEPVAWQRVGRLVFDHDTGGAIRGPGRVDLYWGKGAEAKKSAGVMKSWGRLTYLVPKNIKELRQEPP